jgi:hypothetical protein
VSFAAWLTAATRSRSTVELGCFSGVFYFTFCQAVLAEQLACTCHAVDSWRGTRTAVITMLSFTRTASGSMMRSTPAYRLCTSTFEEALPRIAGGTVDMLPIDGLHTYNAVRQDVESGLPKLSAWCCCTTPLNEGPISVSGDCGTRSRRDGALSSSCIPAGSVCWPWGPRRGGRAHRYSTAQAFRSNWRSLARAGTEIGAGASALHRNSPFGLVALITISHGCSLAAIPRTTT